MTSTPVFLRVALTVAFVAVGGFCVWRCVAAGARTSASSRVDDAWHVIMTASMAAALWAVPRFPDWQAAVLAVACGWFVARAVSRSPAAPEPGRLPVAAAGRSPVVEDGRSVTGTRIMSAGCADVGHQRGVRLRCAHHAILMGLSAW